jgi:hypothetical protein
MGQTQSTDLQLPEGKNFIISYCRHYDVLQPIDGKDSINFINLIPDCITTVSLLTSVLQYKYHSIGYRSLLLELPRVYSKCIDDYFSDLKILDTHITHLCYNVTLPNIRHFLSSGNILIAGILMDSHFVKDQFNLEIKEMVTDIVLIIGYTPTEIIIKTTWKPEPMYIEHRFLNVFTEIWNITIESPEEKYDGLLPEWGSI